MSPEIPFVHSERFQAALRRFDDENSMDPNRVAVNGLPEPRERIYAEWLTAWVLKLCPDASEALRLAARCQHLCRWMIPRQTYPMTRAGYLKWRTELKQFHADRAAGILRELGYNPEIIERVRTLNLKKNFPSDPESRVMEDALCLVFLEHQLSDLADQNPEDKVINALRKSWEKMSSAGRAEALKLNYAPREKVLLEKALSDVR